MMEGVMGRDIGIKRRSRDIRKVLGRQGRVRGDVYHQCKIYMYRHITALMALTNGKQHSDGSI